jgi:hypothetical protein
MSMEGMYLRAWIDGLHRINNERPVEPAERPAPAVLALGSGKLYVRLEKPGGTRA